MANYHRTPEMPLMDSLTQELLQALDNNDSYLELLLLLPNLVTDLTDDNTHNIRVYKTVTEFEKDDFLTMATLMHYIHKDVLRSIFSGTVARDFQRANPPDTYSSRVCGTYICSMSIAGRDGKFLSNRELDMLCIELREYAAAAMEWLEDRLWDPQNPQHDLHRQLIKDVDAQCAVARADGSPRWIDNDSAVERVQVLSDMFEARRDYQLDLANNNNTYHVQSPCMVGCTGQQVEERVKSHKPETLGATTYTWGLTLCILRHMGLNPKVTAIPVIGTCDKNDLAPSEQLVTVLARSMIFQTGYNVIQGGGEKDTRPRGYAEQNLVMIQSSALLDNLDRTLARIGTLRRSVQIERSLRDCKIDSLQTLQNQLETAAIDFKALMISHREAREKVTDQVAAREAEKKKLMQQIDALKAEKELREAVAKSALRRKS